MFQYVPIASCRVLGLLRRVWVCLLSLNSLTRNLYTRIRSYSAFPSSDRTVPAALVSPCVQPVPHQPFLLVFFISSLAEGTAGLVILVISEAVKQCQTQYWPLGYTTDDWAPAGVITADHNSLIPAIQTVFNISCCPFVYSTPQRFVCEDVLGDGAKVKRTSPHALVPALSFQSLVSSEKALRFVRHSWLLVNPCWLLPIT